MGARDIVAAVEAAAADRPILTDRLAVKGQRS
jgi:hypothetical protein